MSELDVAPVDDVVGLLVAPVDVFDGVDVVHVGVVG